MVRHKEAHIRLALLCRSFANPARVAIIEKLAGKRNCMELEIIAVENLAETTVIKHLRRLKEEGIIKGNLAKSKMVYCIDWEKIEEFKLLFDQFYKVVKQHQKKIKCD